MGTTLWDPLYETPSIGPPLLDLFYGTASMGPLYGTPSMGPPLWDPLNGTPSTEHPLWDSLLQRVLLYGTPKSV